jgi:hypothetical protein
MNRKTIAIRQTIATGLALLGLLFVIGKCTAGCKALTPAEQATVAADGVKLSMCATQAHLCKLDAERDDAGTSACWDQYVNCKVVHGFDGGAK